MSLVNALSDFVRGRPREIGEIVRMVNLDAYLEACRTGTKPQYWNRHQRILDDLYEILMENHLDLWSEYRGKGGKALGYVAESLNEVIEVNARPVRITKSKRPDDRKMYFGPANFAYLFDGKSVINYFFDRKSMAMVKKDKPELVGVIATDVEHVERGIKFSDDYDVELEGGDIPGAMMTRLFYVTPQDYKPDIYEFGDFNKDTAASMDVRNARKIFGLIDVNKKPIEVGKTVWLTYRVVRDPTISVASTVTVGVPKAGAADKEQILPSQIGPRRKAAPKPKSKKKS